MLTKYSITLIIFVFLQLSIWKNVEIQAQDSIKAGEHPRLFFTKADLPELKRRAKTPEGKAIVQRLRYQLNGKDGKSLPKIIQPQKHSADNAGKLVNYPVGEVFTLWHGAGYGMLYQLTGDKKYADLGRKCAELMLSGTRDRDARYSFVNAHGALRAGPALSALAMAYDLCYDGWDESFRKKVALAIQNYDNGKSRSFPGLARGSRHHANSNHWGPQIGGATLAALAIYKDPGTDHAKVKGYLDTSVSKIGQQLSKGMGTRGYFTEGLGPGQITTDTALIPAIQALKKTGYRDFTNSEALQWASLRWVMMLYELRGQPAYLNPVKRTTYGGEIFERHGLSRGGQFVQGMGVLNDQQKAMMLWTYEKFIQPTEADWPLKAGLKKGENSYDTVNPYPHRAILALVNWPIAKKAINPGNHLPQYIKDGRHAFHFWRSRWQDKNDPMVMIYTGNITLNGGITPVRVHGYGQLFSIDPGTRGFQVSKLRSGKVWMVSNDRLKMVIDFTGEEPVIITTGVKVVGDNPAEKARGRFNLSGIWLEKPGQTHNRGMKINHSGNSVKAVRMRKQNQAWGNGQIKNGKLEMSFRKGSDSIKVTGEILANGQQIKWSNGTSWYSANFKEAEYEFKSGAKANMRKVNLNGVELSVITFSDTGKHSNIKTSGNSITVGKSKWTYQNNRFQ